MEPEILAPQLDSRELISLLRRKVAGEPCPHRFIHEADAYSAAPEDLVGGREPAPGTDQGDGKGTKWYFFSRAICHDSAQGRSTRKRQRAVCRGCFWRSEAGKKTVPDTDGRADSGYTRMLYYCRRIKTSSGAPRIERLGWCMKEFGLYKDNGPDEFVLCILYRSPRADPETSKEASVPGGGMPHPASSSREHNNQIQPIQPETKDMSEGVLTRIELKRNVTILDIESTRMLDRNTFVQKAISVFRNFEDLGISVDFVATIEGMSFTLVPPKLLSQELIQPMLDNAVKELQKFATVYQQENKSVISLVGNSNMSLFILERALNVLRSIKVEAHKVSHGSSKLVTKISLVVDDSEAKPCVQALDSVFFERNGSPVPVNSIHLQRQEKGG